jgi:ornithine cyclodeaminase
VNDPAMLVRDSQLVVTTTPAREPLLKAEWLHPGLHITAMGSDQAGKQEIDARAIAECDLYVCDSIAQCEALGELRALRASGLAMSSDPVELGKLITGSSVGRQSQGDVTICDLTGTGAQDTVIANHAFGLAGSKEGVSIIST